MPRGRGVRCHGFMSDDGLWVVCTRSEYAGNLSERSGGFHHYLGSTCNCGTNHANGAVIKPAPLMARPDNSKKEYAREIWSQSQPADGTHVAVYLQGRGINCDIPPTIKFHPELKHPNGKSYPTMVAAVSIYPSREVSAVHRTFLLRDGSGKALIEPQKMSLGPIRGGAIRLGPPAEQMAITEGIEDGLTILQETGVSVWAATSASSMRSLVLPELPMASKLVICADPDPEGIRAADFKANEEEKIPGRDVRVAYPDGGDFNDLLRK